MTYGWAVLVVLLVLGVLFYAGVFNTGSTVPRSCSFPAGFTCNEFMVDDSGRLYLELGQATGRAINVTGVGCGTTAGMSLTAMNVQIPSGSHAWVTNTTVTCSGASSPAFKGKISVQYTTAGSGLTRTVTGDIMYPINGNSDSGSSAIWNESFAYYQLFNLTTGVTSNLTDFPFAITLDTATLVSAGKMNADCSDLRAVDSTLTTALDYEIEACNTANTIVWVRAPQTNGTQNFTAYIFYGNPAATDAQNAAGVWRNGYVRVFHLTTLADSVGGSVLTVRGSAAAAAGKFGSGYNMDASHTQWLDGSDSGLPTGSAAYAMCGWVNLGSGEANRAFFMYGSFANNVPAQRRSLFAYVAPGGGTGTYYYVAGSEQALGNPNSIIGAWHYLCVASNGTATHALFVDGVQEATVSQSPATTLGGADGLKLGHAINGGSYTDLYFYGSMDEVRFSNVNRSADWLKAEAGSASSSSAGEQPNGGGANPFSAWAYSRTLTVNTGVSSNLTDFPAYAVVDTAAPIAAGKMNASCKDLRVANATRTGLLAYEIEANTCNTISTIIWFKVPQTNGTQNYAAYLLYGNSAAVDSQSAAAVWSSYNDIWHFGESSGSFASSTGTTAFSQAASNITSDSGCRFGRCIGPSTGNYATAATSAYNSPSSLTFSCWVNRTGAITQYNTILADRSAGGGSNWEGYLAYSDGQYGVYTGSFYNSGTVSTLNAMELATFRINSSKLYMYVNGAKKSTLDFSYGGGAPSQLLLGASYDGNEFLAGKIDECRISKTAKTDDWILAEYAQTYSVGSEQPNS